MFKRLGMGLAGAVLMIGLGSGAASAQEWMPEFPSEVLEDSARISQGGEIWADQCTHCHGFKAYPGKAPKLKPARYKPEFVYARVAKGFRKMPAWEEVYTEDEMISIVSYVLSNKFSP